MLPSILMLFLPYSHTCTRDFWVDKKGYCFHYLLAVVSQSSQWLAALGMWIMRWIVADLQRAESRCTTRFRFSSPDNMNTSNKQLVGMAQEKATPSFPGLPPRFVSLLWEEIPSLLSQSCETNSWTEGLSYLVQVIPIAVWMQAQSLFPHEDSSREIGCHNQITQSKSHHIAHTITWNQIKYTRLWLTYTLQVSENKIL